MYTLKYFIQNRFNNATTFNADFTRRLYSRNYTTRNCNHLEFDFPYIHMFRVFHISQGKTILFYEMVLKVNKCTFYYAKYKKQ